MPNAPVRSRPRTAPICATARSRFLKVLTDNGMVLALDELVPYAHWITPEGMPKRFDTWFFLAAAPPEQVGAHDGKESTDSIWVSPREALEGGESGRFKLPFPTTRNLIKLGKQANVKAALDDSRGKPVVTRDAGHDQDQRRPPAPDSARGRLRRRRVRGRLARLTYFDTRRSIGAGLPDRTHINDPSGDWARRREIEWLNRRYCILN